MIWNFFLHSQDLNCSVSAWIFSAWLCMSQCHRFRPCPFGYPFPFPVSLVAYRLHPLRSGCVVLPCTFRIRPDCVGFAYRDSRAPLRGISGEPVAVVAFPTETGPADQPITEPRSVEMSVTNLGSRVNQDILKDSLPLSRKYNKPSPPENFVPLSFICLAHSSKWP